MNQNRRSRQTGMTGHDRPEYPESSAFVESAMEVLNVICRCDQHECRLPAVPTGKRHEYRKEINHSTYRAAPITPGRGSSCRGAACPEVPTVNRSAGLSQRPATGSQIGRDYQSFGSQVSVCSESSKASSTSMPRYRTVLSSFVCPKSNCTALMFFVRR